MVLGPPGTGKSTFARQLGERLDRPVIHLDAEYWQPGWEPTPGDAWERRHAELIAGEEWIVDGNYGSTLERRADAADAAIILEVPRHVAVYRIVRRWLLDRGESRPDRAAGCSGRLTLEFVRRTWRYPVGRLPEIERTLAQREHLAVVRLASSEDRREFLDSLG